MRSEGAEGSSSTSDCDDPLVVIACAAESDACPAACREGAKEDEQAAPKSGDLQVTASAAANRKILKTGTSDLDTITFKTSEDVTISKITLERYGYSKSEQIDSVWLEDEDGNVIADGKWLTKDKVTLNLKKDYRTVDGKFVATVVVKTVNAEWTIWFKVTDAESTAKNLNLDDYSPYTYEVVDYVGSVVTVEMKGTPKTYNYEEGESYEIARVKVAAGDNAVLVRWFTLSNAGKVDMKESLDELTVKADSKEIKAKASVNKDDELVVSFNEDVEIDINKKVTFVLSASFKDFDDYGESVSYYIAEDADFNAVEKKNETRVNLNLTKAVKGNEKAYQFNGGKIKLTNTKLGNVDAAQASEGTVIAEGNISVTEPISKISFDVVVPSLYVDKLTMIVNGEEFDGTSNKTNDVTKTKNPVYNFTNSNDSFNVDVKWTVEFLGIEDEHSKVKVLTIDNNTPTGVIYYVKTTNLWKNGGGYTLYTDTNGTVFTYDNKPITLKEYSLKDPAEWSTTFHFTNVSIEKSGKVQFTVDIADDELAGGSFQVATPFNGTVLTSNETAKYDNVSKQYVKAADVAGSISFSKVTIQPAKAALENNLTKDVEFLQNETAKKVVFDGTYTAKKGDIDLNKFTVTANSNALAGQNKVTFYLSIDGDEVADTDTLGSEESFSDVRVKAGESVKIKVEAEVEAYDATIPTSAASYQIELKGTDMNGNEDTGKGSERLMNIKIKAKGSVTIPSTSEAKTALLKAANTTVAKFTVKPSNNNEGLMLEDMTLTATVDGNSIDPSDLRVKVAGVEQDDESLTYSVNEEIPTEGLVVEVILKQEQAGKVKITVKKINDKDFNNVYEKYLVSSLVTFVNQDEGSSSTEYTLDVEHSDDAYSVKNFNIYAMNGSSCDTSTAIKTITSELAEDESFTIMRWNNPVEICQVSYVVYDGTNELETVNIDKATYKDYFKVGGKELAIPKA